MDQADSSQTLRSPLFESSSAEDSGILRLGLAGMGDFRWAVVDVTRPLEALRRRLDPSPVVAVALGQAMASAALLLRFSTKYPGRLRFEAAGDGPLGKVSAEVDSDGFMRAIADQLQFPGVEGDDLNVGAAVGEGLLRVTQESERRPEPWVSQTSLADGGLGQSLVTYLHQSQQVHSAALLSVRPGGEGIVAAGGILIEALPGADEGRLEQLEQNIGALEDVGSVLQASGDEGLVAKALSGFDLEELEKHTLRYSCKCSRDVLLQRLMSLPDEELDDVADETGKAILECAFCLGQFVFGMDELKAN